MPENSSNKNIRQFPVAPGTLQPHKKKKSPKPPPKGKLPSGAIVGIAAAVVGTLIIGFFGWRYFSARSQRVEMLENARVEFQATMQASIDQTAEQFGKELEATFGPPDDSKVPRGDYDPKMEVDWSEDPERQAKSLKQRKEVFAILEAKSIKRWLGKDTRPAFTKFSSTMSNKTEYRLKFRNVKDEVAELKAVVTSGRLNRVTLTPRGKDPIMVPISEVTMP